MTTGSHGTDDLIRQDEIRERLGLTEEPYTPDHLTSAFLLAFESDDQLPGLEELDRQYDRAGIGSTRDAYRAGINAALIAICGYSLPSLRAQAAEAAAS